MSSTTNEPPAPQGRRVTVTMVTLLSCMTVLLVASGRGEVEISRPIFGTTLLWLCAFPTWHYFNERTRSIPYLPAMAAIYFFSYGLPAFNRALRVNAFRPAAATVEVALFLSTTGMLLLLLAFYWSRLPKATPRLTLDLALAANGTKLLVISVATLALRVVLLRVKLPAELVQLGDFLGYLPVALLNGVFLLRLRGQLVRWQSALWLPLVITVLLLDFSSGAMAQPAFTLANFLFVYVAERGRLPVLALAVILLVFVPALATKLEYRHQVSRRGIEGTVERLNLFGELMAGVFTGDRMSFGDADEIARSRVDHLSAFSFVIAKTPSVVPFWDGATYANFLWSFVPRVLAPDKPKKTLGQEYGHRYGFIGRWDLNTSINLEQTVEMYANFGVPGVLFGMMLLGIIYRGLYTVLNHPNSGDGGILVAASTFRILLNIESDFSLVFGGIVQTALLLYAVLWLLARRPHARMELAT